MIVSTDKDKKKTTYQYDDLNELLSSETQDVLNNGSISSITYTYDESGNLIKSMDEIKNVETFYQYDSDGQMISYQSKVGGKDYLSEASHD